VFSLDHLRTIREAEIEKFTTLFSPHARILEIGAGTGQQALALAQRGFDVVAIEIADSTYREARVFPVTEYDGRHIPADDASIDIVFSSNVLEHVTDLHQMNSEIRRVLKPGGYCVHIMPTHSWRFWTTLSAFPDALLYAATVRSQLVPRLASGRNIVRQTAQGWWGFAKHLSRPFRQERHGERGNLISETWLFHPNWWRKAFKTDGFEIVRDFPMGHFYTGNMLLGSRMSMTTRAELAKIFGSACHLFQVRPVSRNANTPAATQ
jgi:ubiquinone/menaquinone biosynthesis C-methylase UbiE